MSIHTLFYMYTNICTYTIEYIYIYMCMHIENKYSLRHVNIYTHHCAYVHICICTYTQTIEYIYKLIQTCKDVHAPLFLSIHAYIYIHMYC